MLINLFQFFPKQRWKSYKHLCLFNSNKYTNISDSGLLLCEILQYNYIPAFTSNRFKIIVILLFSRHFKGSWILLLLNNMQSLQAIFLSILEEFCLFIILFIRLSLYKIASLWDCLFVRFPVRFRIWMYVNWEILHSLYTCMYNIYNAYF
jgi:hypothetical protein